MISHIMSGSLISLCRSDTVEPILSLSIFPADFSSKDKVTNWVRIFSGFDKIEIKAFEKILEQKQRSVRNIHIFLFVFCLLIQGRLLLNYMVY